MTGTMHIMGREGDTKIEWEPGRLEQVEAARAMFDKLRGRGYLAFRTDRHGGKGEQLLTFDQYAERIIMAPPMVGGG